eukprot:SAG31_NODE_2123_length_6401_cov_4.982069_6_plen_58_part_00
MVVLAELSVLFTDLCTIWCDQQRSFVYYTTIYYTDDSIPVAKLSILSSNPNFSTALR